MVYLLEQIAFVIRGGTVIEKWHRGERTRRADLGRSNRCAAAGLINCSPTG